jgi:hypothetical protein
MNKIISEKKFIPRDLVDFLLSRIKIVSGDDHKSSQMLTK